LLDCFDLFVGQRIDVLGKPTTLLQGDTPSPIVLHCFVTRTLLPANFETLEWLEYHAEKSLQQARALEIEIAKFKTTMASVTELAKKRSNGRGTHNLRWIASKIEFLKKELLQVCLFVHRCAWPHSLADFSAIASMFAARSPVTRVSLPAAA
jgi:hypothetical protein